MSMMNVREKEVEREGEIREDNRLFSKQPFVVR